ncbi:ATP-dependent endonuclease [Arthrobacter sp. NPDC058097]|uniref:ATP-dependent nuclease n=1 Tax=Arthrobacter sp. NPDC058097 TaxID=3346340 RepID=UPI0036DF3CE5
MIEKLLIRNFKKWEQLDVTFNDELNILVGDNDAGKSTIIEAIEMVLSGRLGGRPVDQELASHWFSKSRITRYLEEVKANRKAEIPSIQIEVYFRADDDLAALRGRNNLLGVNAPGYRLHVSFDQAYESEYAELLADGEIDSLPIEYFHVERHDFAGERAALRNLPVRATLIDTVSSRLYSGVDYYLKTIITESITTKERAQLALAYRTHKGQLAKSPAVLTVNNALRGKQNTLQDLTVTLGVETSGRSSWESAVIPHFDDIPFSSVGKGEQSAFKMLLAMDRHAADKHVVLVEEPENHLSFSNLNRLVSLLQARAASKQLFVSTHSSFVLNKLGLDRLVLLSRGANSSFNALTPETREHFMKLAGYDTLRLVLSRAVILVEGPSDELIVQKAFEQIHGCPPIEMGVDVISVGLTFKRFLELGKLLKLRVSVITDLDDNESQEKARKRFEEFEDENIKGFVGAVQDGRTLEPQLVSSMGHESLGALLGQELADKAAAAEYMEKNKTDVALAIASTTTELEFPSFIMDAIAHVID